MSIIRFACAMVLCLAAEVAMASGSFSPVAMTPKGEQYNLVKALVTGQKSGFDACQNCHERFARSKLNRLRLSMSSIIQSCEQHQPCYSLSDKQRSAIDAYFKKRYRLK